MKRPGWLLVLALTVAAIGAFLLLFPCGAYPQDLKNSDLTRGAENSSAPCDHARRACLTVEKWALALRAWSPGATDPRDLAGGRLQAELRFGRWRVQARADGTATSGAYKQGDWSTVRDVEAHAAASYDLLRLPGKDQVTVGPMVAVGGAVALPEKGIRASLGRSVTAVLGVAGSWKGGRVHVGVGQAHPLDRGLALAMTWQIPLGERTASLGYVAVGRRHIPAAVQSVAATALEAAESGGSIKAGDLIEALVPAHSEAAIVAWVGVGVRL